VSGVKRKIRAKEFVQDLRNGMSDRQFMEKYALSPDQLRKLFRKLVDSGTIDEMQLYMRTTLSDSAITRTLSESRRAIQESEDTSSLQKTVGTFVPQRLKRRVG
jgi:hypothetical protein